MRSLFLRIFVWFCGLTLLLLAIITTTVNLTMPDAFSTGWRQVGRGSLVASAKTAAAEYERAGPAGLEKYFSELSSDAGLKPELLDESGQHLGGAALGAPANALSGVRERPSGQLALLSRGGIAAVHVTGPSRANYFFLAAVPSRGEEAIVARSLILAFILIGCLLSYSLARYLTAPVVRLRELASRFAEGDLTARITEPWLLGRQDEIGGLSRDFDDMAARIETLIKAQKRLLADVSHELRSPLTRMGLALGLLRRDSGEAAQNSIRRMEREIDRLNSLIQQLLTLSRLEAATDPPKMERLDLAGMVEEVVADADFEAQHLRCRVRLMERNGSVVVGVPELWRSAVENVVRNAVQYTAPDTEVQVRLTHPAGTHQAVITVADRGPGVPEAELAHIFEPFHRIGLAPERHRGGAGLGLAITQQVVNLHGGAVQASNLEAGGLEVRISVPLAESD